MTTPSVPAEVPVDPPAADRAEAVPLDYENSPPPPPPALGQRAASGFAWTVSQAVGSKVVSVAGQIVLARLLASPDWGLYGHASSLLALPAVLGQVGVREVLVRGGAARFDSLSGSALSLCATFGTLGVLAMAATIPLGMWLWNDPRLLGMILLFALSALPNTLVHVPTAKLQIDLRFRAVSVIAFVHQSGLILLSMLFAFIGWGPYSFAAPWPIMAVVRLVLTWWAARFAPHGGLQVRQWGELIGNSLWVLLFRAIASFISVGDYLLLGLFHTEDTLGIYFFAFNLSMQTMSLLALNMESVLFPTLNHIKDDAQRQRTALLSALRVLSLIGVPASLVQMALAEPLVRLLFGHKWDAAIPVLQVLSIGMAVRLMGFPATSLIQAQGRFRTNVVTLACLTATFLTFVAAAAAKSPADRAPINVAWAVAAYFCLESPIYVLVAIGRGKTSVRQMLSAFRGPVLVGVVTAAACYAASKAIPAFRMQHVTQLAIGGIAAAVAFFISSAILEREGWTTLRVRFSMLLKRT